MDPLSVTLAVVTFATAVKDMVELGQKIHESFAKVSKNLRNAQRVAKEIKEMAEEIEVFYEANKDVLDSMKDFGMALEGLLNKFRSFDRTILPLLPQTDRSGPGLFLRGWWNNNKVEGRILDLESDIVKVMRRYMMSGVMRNEVKLERIHQDANKHFTNVQTGITQGLEVLDVVRKGVSIIAATMPSRSYQSAGTSSDEFDRNVIMFAQSTASTSVPMLRTPTVITEELMTAAYIKLQINNIAITVEKMSTLPVSALNLNDLGPFKLTPLREHLSMGIMHLRHHVVRQVTGIRGLLDTNHVHAISIYEGSNDLSWLSDSLGTLGMSHESILVGKWAITLSQTVVGASGGGQPHLDASLALFLVNQAMKYRRSGDDLQSVQAVKEAYTITRTLLDHHGGEIHFQILHSSVLLKYAYFVDNQQSIEMILQAIQLLERILNVQAFSHSGSHKQFELKVVQPDLSFFDNLFSSAPPMSAIIEYTLALRRLGNYLFIDGRPEAALDLARLSIVLLRKIVSTHGHMYRVNLADALSILLDSKTASCIPAEELVDLANECIQIYRELTEKNPLYYARQLVDVLWVKANKLDSLNRNAESIATWEEVASLAGQIVQDSELCANALATLSSRFRALDMHDDAVRTGRLAITTYQQEAETEAQIYTFLSQDLQQLRRYKESAEAAQKSVTLYRHPAMRYPETWMGYLTDSLSNFALCLAASGDYSEALMIWSESVSMLDNFLNTDTGEEIEIYLAALRNHLLISNILEDEESLKVSATAIQHLRQLAKFYPNADLYHDLLQAEYCHAYIMLRVGRLQDGQQYIDQWHDIWSNKSEVIPESEMERWHAAMTALKAAVLDAQGCTKQALLVTQKVHDIVGPFITTSSDLFDKMIETIVREARLRATLGESEEAMQAAEEALRLSRDNKLEPITHSLVWSLYGTALAMLSCHNYNRAVETAREGCKLLASPDGLEFWQDSELYSFLRPSLFAILSSAEANLGRHSTALEYAHTAVDASLEIRDNKASVSATTAEHSYMETRGNLAEILLATGNIAQALQICDERRVYFSKRVEKRMGEYRDLAPILRMLGVLCCSEGRHDEGDAAAQELSKIIKTLGSAFPSLQEQVKIRLRRQAKVPILKALDDMCQKLDCKHQTGVTALFEI